VSDPHPLLPSEVLANAPPVRPGPIGVAPKPPSWPTVIGVVAIALGALGAFGGLWGIAAPFLMETMGRFMPQGDAGIASMREHAVHSAIYSAVATCLAVLLIVGGAHLVKRRASSVKLLRLYAFLRIPEAFWGTFLTYLAQRGQFDAMQQQGGPPMPAALAQVIMLFTLVFTITWALAMPAFLLVWFARARVREDVARWFKATPA
jgi:hypothetical protein